MTSKRKYWNKLLTLCGHSKFKQCTVVIGCENKYILSLLAFNRGRNRITFLAQRAIKPCLVCLISYRNKIIISTEASARIGVFGHYSSNRIEVLELALNVSFLGQYSIETKKSLNLKWIIIVEMPSLLVIFFSFSIPLRSS